MKNIYSKNNRCIDCNKKISKKAINCSSCAAKERLIKNGNPNFGKKHPGINKGKNNGSYKDGRCSKKYYCKCGNEITYHCIYCGNGRCSSCSMKEKMKNPKMIQIAKNNLPENTKGKNNPNWQGGISKLPYAFEFTEQLKEQIRKHDNYECKNCGITEEEHLIVYGLNLTIHHIDYNKENCKENNLITLCNGCNSRANFNRDFWKNYYTNKIKILLPKGD